MKTKLLLSVLLSFVYYLLSSQVPQGFNYQAIARDTTGKPIINTALPVRITIQSDSLGGTRFWIEEHNSVTTNSYGLFNIILGKGVKQVGSTVNAFYDIDWSETPKFIKTEIDKNGWKNMGSSRLWSVPYSMVAGDLNDTLKKLIVKGRTDIMDEALFEVKNKTGQTVFAVYNEGVRVYVDDGSKGKKAGFAIGGFNKTKDGINQDYFIVNRDSVRVYLDTLSVKTRKGGFAIGGFNRTKGVGDEEYLRVTRDSTRIYINDLAGKTRKGGFAIGGFNQTKAGNKSFLNVATDATGVINPSQNRILWYPLKNAFLTGKVLIEKPDSVGVNSFASGYESKAKGMYSQALGYNAIARGDYSTAIGKNALASRINSFAFGDSAQAINNESYAIGRGAVASGYRSFAFGSAGVDREGNPTDFTRAIGDYSFAFGQGSQALGKGAVSIGLADTARGDYSISMGYGNCSDEYFSTSMGYYTSAKGMAATSMGYWTQAKGQASFASGYWTLADGHASTALGEFSRATGESSTAIGKNVLASGTFSVAIGDNAQAINTNAMAIGPLGPKASGYASFALGNGTKALSGYETAIGTYNSSYTPVNIYDWHPTDRLFVIGKGQYGSPSNAMTILKNGCIGLQSVTVPTYALQLPNSTTISIGVARAYSWSTYSDNRLKENQIPLSYGLNEIIQLIPKEYLHHSSIDRSTWSTDNSKKTIGLVAQDVYKVIPEAVNVPENDNSDLWGLDYDKLIPVLVKAVQEQQQQIESYKSQLQLLQEKVEQIEGQKKEIDELKAIVNTLIANQTAQVNK